uniref:CCHC-type domain-containing protein n=1 Tax=Gasterosteus aculeatus aculeatus TaxID=481459 RepID=A0AAQ4R8C7_GASAC
MYNPYVGDETVISWLSRYGKVESAVRYLRDSFGIWSGRRQFKVLLEDNPGGGGGLRHPPAYFSIGEDRGFLFYSGQPSFCRQCRSFGHMATDCTEGRCRNCGGRGHSVAACGAPKTCHGCGGEGHIVRDCFLFYSGQPSFCRQCRSFGHMATDCTEGRCRNCGGRGHSVAAVTSKAFSCWFHWIHRTSCTIKCSCPMITCFPKKLSTGLGRLLS